MESTILGAAEAGEDLAPLGQVPVAERVPRHARARRPRAAAQHLVAGPEEGLGVLAIGVGAEARVAAEGAGGPLPGVSQQSEHAVGRRALGVAAGRQRAERELVEVRALAGRRL